MRRFFASIDTILWGRKTYEIGVRLGGPSLGFGKRVRHYVFTRRPPESAPPRRIEFVNEPVPEFARRLRAERGKDVWIMGGAGLIASFLDAGEIDEFRIGVIPIFIGEGIPLIEPHRRRDVPLELLESEAFPDGVVQVHYRVARTAAKKGTAKPAAGRSRRRGSRG